ncbi:hypothetical protein [Kitasatospora sp. DSM 101779]|uniref:hypothetical protein n=1 Tax=Kitasatospora sp. DSM 101779 TaxID=2853165 RepID=UPI0021DB28BB|nr:hypothetical protein [Kitasatospora sp. DSM 101779]MCU7822143.1 hypothetical protein [Kitasatospora sp. DSM 101779]
MKKATEMRRALRRALLTGAAAALLLLGTAGVSSAGIPIESWNNTGASAGDASTGSSPHTADIHIGSWNSTGADYHRPPTVS